MLLSIHSMRTCAVGDNPLNSALNSAYMYVVGPNTCSGPWILTKKSSRVSGPHYLPAVRLMLHVPYAPCEVPIPPMHDTQTYTSSCNVQLKSPAIPTTHAPHVHPHHPCTPCAQRAVPSSPTSLFLCFTLCPQWPAPSAVRGRCCWSLCVSAMNPSATPPSATAMSP